MLKPLLFTMLCLLVISSASSQKLRPGFDKYEYIDLMSISAQFGSPAYASKLPLPTGSRQLYRSPVIGLGNMWDLWITGKGIAVLNIRGTTAEDLSWLANFYAAMIPASGELQLSATQKFPYKVADNPRAAVHVGWMVSTAFLVTDMRPKIDSLYSAGMRDMLVMGHSQGGGIAFLLTAYLYQLQKQGLLPADIRFKTYCSAGPKPGNLYFAQDYEALTQEGWGYNVVNALDWVPETPVSIQTEKDFNALNPFTNVPAMIRKQGFFKRLALKYAYGKLTKPTAKAVRNYQRFLGGFVVKSVKKQLPGFVEPRYANTNNYVRTGNTISLVPDEEYLREYPQDTTDIFINHFHPPYIMLVKKIFMNQSAAPVPPVSLAGKWELNYISGRRIAFEGLYPDRKPFINIDAAAGKVSGNTNCNSFNGQLTIDNSSIRFAEAMAMTRMMCPGEGEQAFLSVLKTVNKFSLNENVLTLLVDDVAVMRFAR